MVLHGLFGAAGGEPGDGVFKVVGLADVATEHGSITGLGVRQCQRPAAQLAVLDEAFGADAAGLQVDAALHVTQLAHIEMHTVHLTPAQEDVGRALDQALSDHHAFALVAAGGQWRRGIRG